MQPAPTTRKPDKAAPYARRRIPFWEQYCRDWEAFFDRYASQVDAWRRRNAGYHDSIRSLAGFYIPPGARVLEIGSGSGDLLAQLRPSYGMGIDISREMVNLASRKYPHLHFRQMAAESLSLDGEQFDYVLLSDTVGYLYDIQETFQRIRQVCHPRTRLVLHWYSRLWQPVLTAAELLGLKYRQPLVNWTAPEDIANFLDLAGFQAVHHRGHVLLPLRAGVLGRLANRYLAHLPGLRWLCLTNWMVARPLDVLPAGNEPAVSVICPCRDEAGNVHQIAGRLPAMGARTELIFVEGHSRDDTLEQCRRVAASFPEKNIRVLVQAGRGKGDAVRLGLANAAGDILMILDADLSVAPEELVSFYRAVVSGKAEFINGSRLVYSTDPKAMRFLNLLANKFFAVLLSRLIGQPVKDTLCGAKVFWRADYERIAASRSYFGEFDPFGDFDLLFGAAKLNLKIAEVPIRYRERVYGLTNINRFADGWTLLRMSAKAAAKLVFIE